MTTPVADTPTISVSKLEAAERQLVTAVRLFVKGEDPISIHTLMAAAYEVLRDLGKARGVKSIFFDLAPIRPELIKPCHIYRQAGVAVVRFPPETATGSLNRWGARSA